MMHAGKGPHQNQTVVATGASIESAPVAMVMVHGRGATAENILTLAFELKQPDIAYLAPQAAGNSWYPYSFLAPIERNEPGLSSGLAVIATIMEQVAAAGIPPERTILLGFSQGACLSLEFAARNAQRYGAVIGLSGGLIGPEGTPRDYPGSLDGTPVFLGCSDIDPHIPLTRVQESTEILRGLGGTVTERIYPGMAHIINQEEIDCVQQIAHTLLPSS
ncbi:MAG: phospholipase [Chloroflexi bacterium AL-W]|nr:phospholipase [Chloroflexi bacterium AL-N1]NOK64672.1 phospholipase [Chloroflexi bacterium AL-N10]NOK75913.1 phospholipase [Chloroflexi bacterium AL-N5]NOK80328.1 phospholipase [Chloroflexi bacterium AL-W]NOK86841.1 phospholipase [Chloroflexi bacterium AL-N15]